MQVATITMLHAGDMSRPRYPYDDLRGLEPACHLTEQKCLRVAAGFLGGIARIVSLVAQPSEDFLHYPRGSTH